ncbi:MAG TPA: beta-ketoacyl-[acyl-carrier-protein] synthase family protein [Pirellulales bacterium]|nr:beta-ketoacyl-[acyl-carrier-protein] synthase family protein [Pirellulales bacterium]
MQHEQPIWITGVGALSPLGCGFDEISKSLLAGRSAIRPIADLEVQEHPCKIAGQLVLPPSPPELDAAAYNRFFPLEQCALACSVQALKDAGLWERRHTLRIGVVLGAAAEWMSHWDADTRRGGKLIDCAAPEYKPLTDTLLETLGLSGPAMSVAAACASGNLALAQACDWLRMDWVDVCLAGACDMGVTPYSLASFGNLRALSRRNDQPTAAVRPFDRDRDGMVLGEGGAMFVLQGADRVDRHVERVYAEVAGVGMTSDGYHLVTPSPDSTQAIAAIREALEQADEQPGAIDYINAHATGTPVGDASESRMLHAVLGPHRMKTPVSSTKGMTGHLLGAAAAIEALACLTAMTYGAIPPTINLDNPDPECELDHVANTARPASVRVAVSNSFGFGGHNTSLVLKAI